MTNLDAESEPLNSNKNESKSKNPASNKDEKVIPVPLQLQAQHSDDLLKMGKYTILVCIFVEIAMLSQLSNTMLMVYAGSSPTIKSCGNLTFSSNEDACQNFDFCENKEITFTRQFYGITEKFLLLCENARFEKIGTSIQMIGLCLGCLFFGQISDLYGRKKPMMFCLVMCVILGIISAFSPDFLTFTIFRTALCFFNGGQSTISVVYMIENVPKRSRMYISTLISYSPNVILLGIIAYFFQEWDSLIIVISVLTIPAILILATLYESPRWLMQKGKVEEAKEVILKINKNDREKMNEKELLELLTQEYHQFSSSSTNSGSSSRTQHSFYHLFSTKEIGIGTFVIAFTFFSTTVINYSNMFNLGAISGSIYMNSILIGLLRYSVSITCGFLDYNFVWFNRKKSHGLCTSMTIIAILATLLIYICDVGPQFAMIIRFCVLLSCASTSQSIVVASVTSNELMPTAVRSLSYSVAQLSCRFGIVFSPHIFYLNLYFGNHYFTLPYFMLLILAVADLLFFRYLIPETKNKPLQDHIIKKTKNRKLSSDKEAVHCELHDLKPKKVKE